ncbi:MAG: carbohydrate ABC transporter permease [Caldilineaceae bacterium]|nr:carbohydrate ABC transporter permease [Caldilineaceae bacterium]MCB0157880.1 carbohydrate ABC transporter permease [Caldilineaceae bacterium]MCB9162498.1 carbohydrate ABC transporter permease [Caldilineaceae bacterium]
MLLRRLRGLLNHSLAAIASLIMFIPVYLVVVNSVKTQAEAASMNARLPTSLNWSNFTTVVEKGKLVTAFGNSVLYSVSATVLGITLAALAAYVLSRNRTRFNRAVYFFIIMGIAMPTNFVTLTKVMQMVHLINTQLGIIVLYAASSIPFSVFLIYAFVETIPRELDEAAIIDGCSPFRLFFAVIYPLLTPVLVTAGVLNLLGIWNEFLLPLYYLNRSTYWPMTLAVYNFFGQFQSDWSLVSADILLTILPVIIIYLFAQRFILTGMTAGSVKG